MTTPNDLDACKRLAFQLKASHPHIKHAKRLDLAAQLLGYAHFTALRLAVTPPQGEWDEIEFDPYGEGLSEPNN